MLGRYARSIRLIAVSGTLITACTTARPATPPPAVGSREGFILEPSEGDSVPGHLIKVDPARGSQRLGIGRQQIPAGRSISLHIHDGEDEVLYIVSGRGIGVVGSLEREVVAGSVIYVPQGAWHGLRAFEPMEIMWIVSPPNFARSLRDLQDAGGQSSPESRREEIARSHQQSDSRAFLRRVLASSEWLGDIPWERVTFGADGLSATYRSGSTRGVLKIRDERREDLSFIGVWQNDAGENGEFILTYEFASGSVIHLDSGERFECRSAL